jgi:hypothetical protein
MDQGVMFSPNSKPGETSKEITDEIVASIYDEEASTVIPGKKYYVPIKVSGVDIH